MADVLFVRKQHLGSGNFEWTYRCQCEAGQESSIKVTSGNENEARSLAQLDCDASCGEAVSSSLAREYAEATRMISVPGQPGSAFIVWVNAVTDDAYVVSLCSGDDIIVPREMVKSFRPLGRAMSDGSEKSNLTARLELRPDAPGALTVIQLAKALERQLGSALAAPEGDRNVEVCERVKVIVNGMACEWGFGYFNSAHPLTGAALARAENCQVGSLTRIGQTQVRFSHSGLLGTPCRDGYTGHVYLDLCWLQP